MIPITRSDLRDRLGRHSATRADAAGRSEAAVALVLAGGRDNGPDLLLIRRAEVPGDPWSGQMGLPGGRREDGDENLLATAIRETGEEVGIVLDASWVLGELDDLAPVSPTLPPVVVRPIVFWLDERPGIRPSPEVAVHLWTPVRSLPASAVETVVSVRSGSVRVAAFQVEGHVVWGMTHRILLNFIALLK